MATRMHSPAPLGAPTLDDVLIRPATDLAARIRAGELSPTELVEAYIRRIEAVNPALNALVADRFDAARDEARRAENRLRTDPENLPPLLGVPFTVKEMIAVEGMPSTFGSLTRRDRVADRDATIVQRLREAGAIPLGVTNVPEWGFWFETTSLVYGRARNPYDPRRTPGGSSGGEGALIGAAASPFGLGSDIGGSIRMPAAFCGVFGHKPTPGLLPLTGHYPVYASGPDAEQRKPNPFVTLGPITRSARDLMPLLRIMAGPDGVDPNARPLQLHDPEDVDWRGRRVLVLSDPRVRLAARATQEVRNAVRDGARALQDMGATIEPLPNDIFHRAVEFWFAALRSIDGPSLAAIIGGNRPLRLANELARSALRRPRFSLPVLMIALAERWGSQSPNRHAASLRRLEATYDDLLDRLGDDAILLLPPHPRVAPRHNRPLLRPFDFAYTGILNALRLPATVAPIGLDRRGLPLGVQFAAAPGNDHLTIAAALVAEHRFGGWKPPHKPLTNNVL